MNPVAAVWSPSTPDTWGGGEEAVVQWTRAMARHGHEVTVLWQGAPCTDGQVRYVTEGTPGLTFDVLVCRKRPDGPRLGLAPHHILWGEGGLEVPDPGAFAVLVAPSEFCRRAYQVRIPALRAVTIPLGYDPQTDCPQHVERDPNLVLHTSSPDRGLVELLKVWPAVLEARPEARLDIAYGWDLYDACGGPPGPKAEVQMFLGKLPGIHMARRPRYDMASLYGRAAVWAYYCTGGEDFCLSAIKAHVNGCIPVVKPWGALHETSRPPLGFADAPETFRDHLIAALDPARQAALREATSATHARTWDDVAAAWGTLLEAVVAAQETPASLLQQVPRPPVDLVPDAAREAYRLLPGLVREWLARTKAERLWCEPNTGLTARPLPPDTLPDAYVIGWGIEDTFGGPRAVFDDLHVPDGAHILVLSSLGPWRAKERHRVLDRHTIMAMFGQQPDIHTSVTPLTEDGSAVCVTTFRYRADTLGQSDPERRITRTHPSGSVSVCLMAPRVMSTPVIQTCLRSVECIADEVVVALNGETTSDGLDTAALVEDWSRRSGIEARCVEATSPRYCFDCLAIHPVGDEAHGHRFAGFETPRNQSIAPARGDWILWIDADEELLHGERLRKYLRPNMFRGYAVAQDHFACDPPSATKRDNPMRLFRREPDGTPAGFIDDGPEKWPTFHPGLTMRFAGLVHEHPGEAPDYGNGANPVMLLNDVWLAHGGYYTEPERRGRFVRNWPLMVADRVKYPSRELGAFLWLRDLAQHLRYAAVVGGTGQVQMTPTLVAQAKEAIRIYHDTFLEKPTPYSGEAATYAGAAATLLGEGFDVQVSIRAQCPEVSGPENMTVELQGRVKDSDELRRLIASRLGALDRWAGPYR